MNRQILFTVLAITGCLGIASVNSQAPQQESGSITAALAPLAAIKAANLELLQRQEKALKTLEALHSAAEQVKTFGKRS